MLTKERRSVADTNQTICEKRTYSEALCTHDHHYGQLLFPLQGSMHIQTARQSLKLQGDSLFYLPPDCTHTFHSPERNEFLVLDIPKFFLFQAERNTQDEGMYMNLNEQWKSLRFLLLEETHRDSRSTALTHLVQYISHSLIRPQYRSIRYIHDHYADRLTVKQLAEMEHYHPAYYRAWFYKVTGMNPTTYIHHVRLKAAKYLLKETDWTITTIAREVGYDYPASFTRLFVRYEGQTPQVYRKMLAKG